MILSEEDPRGILLTGGPMHGQRVHMHGDARQPIVVRAYSPMPITMEVVDIIEHVYNRVGISWAVWRESRMVVPGVN